MFSLKTLPFLHFLLWHLAISKIIILVRLTSGSEHREGILPVARSVTLWPSLTRIMSTGLCCFSTSKQGPFYLGIHTENSIPPDLWSVLEWWIQHHTRQQFTHKKLTITHQTDHFSCEMLAWYALVISNPTNLSQELPGASRSSYEGKKAKRKKSEKLGYSFWKVLTHHHCLKRQKTKKTKRPKDWH